MIKRLDCRQGCFVFQDVRGESSVWTAELMFSSITAIVGQLYSPSHFFILPRYLSIYSRITLLDVGHGPTAVI